MDCTSAFRKWWDDLTREGDPMRIPKPCAKGFTAGWYACEREYERKPTPADRGTARAIIAHMEQPIPCRHCGKPLHIHSLGWKHSENGYLTCNVSGMVRIAEPKPDTLTCEDYDPDVEAERKWIAGLDGAHPQMGEDYETGESMPLSLITREQGGHVRTLNLPSFQTYEARRRKMLTSASEADAAAQQYAHDRTH